MQDTLIKILMVEDNTDHACLAKYALEASKSNTVTIVSTPKLCYSTLQENQFDIIILDYNLPGDNGLNVLKKLVEDNLTEAPIVLVTGHGHEKIAVEAMKAGAFDYVVKTGDYANILPNVVKRVLERFRIVSEKRRMEAEIRLRNNELQVLNSVSAVLNESLVLDEILDTALSKIATELPLDAVAVLLRETDSERLNVQSVKGEFNDIFEKNITELPSWKRLEQSVMIEQKLVINQLVENSEFPFVHDFLNGHLNSFISLPLVCKSETMGTFIAASKNEAFFTNRRLNLLSAIVNQMSVAVQNSQLYLDTKLYKNELENLFNSSLDMIVTLDAQGIIQFKNEGFDKIFGNGKDLTGKSFLNFMPEKSRQKIIENLGGKGKKATTYETELTDSRERQIPCLISQSNIKGSEKYLMIIKDVSQIAQLQKQLIQAEKLSALGQMIAGAAHELNNPLAGILGYGQLLLEEKLEESVNKDIQVIVKEAQRCKDIVQNLLRFARKQNSVREKIDIHKMLGDILKLQGYQFRINSIEISKDFDPNLPEIVGDFNQLQQVFLHLIRNAEDALKISSKHGKKFRIKTKNLGSSIRIKFEDNACGISSEIKDRIFDPFFTTKEVGEGTGLGLSLCFGIVQGHHGQLLLEKTNKNGSVFTVELPVFQADDDQKFEVNNMKPLTMASHVSI